MHEITFLQDIAIVMAVSAVVTIICHQFRLPIVLGYIIAGIIIGPHTPPYSLITDQSSIYTLSELGVIFLLFAIGLEFSMTKLLKVGMVSFFAATLEIVLMLIIGYTLGRAFGWTLIDSLFLGAILSISSTTIIAKILMDNKKLQERFAQIILGILVIEDVLAIVIIAVLSGIVFTGEVSFHSAFIDLLKVLGFIVGILFVGFLIVPRILSYIHSFKSSEMMVITVLGLCFGASLMAAKMEFSVALGAFLIGAVIAETKQSKFILRHFESIRDMFTAVFFVSVGMLLDPKVVVDFAVPILIITFITIIGKIVSCTLATFLTGDKPETAFKVGLGLAQIGEFSFIIANLGENTKVTSSFIFPIAVAVSSLTTLSTPFLMKYSDVIIDKTRRKLPHPIRTSAGLYSAWLKRIQTRNVEEHPKSIFRKNLKIFLPRILFYALCSIILFSLPPKLSMMMNISLRMSWIIIGLFICPILFGLLASVDQLFWRTLSAHTVKRIEDDKNFENAHNMLRFALVIFSGLITLAVSSIFIPYLPLNLILLVIILLSSLVLWDSVRKVHERIEKTVWGLFDHENFGKIEDKKIHDELVQIIQEDYPWGVETQDIILPYHESAVNCSIKDLGIRTHSGATIVAIYRDEETLINPKPDIVLLPGDVLLLMGNKVQLEKAIKYLQQKMKEKPAK